MPNEETLEWRLAQIERGDTINRLTTIESKVSALQEMPDTLDSIRSWLFGVLGGLIVALILLVMDLAIGYHPNVPTH